MRAVVALVVAAGCAGPGGATPSTPSTPLQTNGSVYTDADRDMILDVCDRCPNKPETFNGYQDDDGCPEEVTVTDIEDIFLDHVYFEHEGTNIAKRQLELVSGEADYWKRHPEIERIACVGRAADNEAGTTAGREQLSFQRARSLCDQLEKFGVSPTRLVAYGLANRDPRRPGKTTDRDRSIERSAVSAVMLAAGKRFLRWDGKALQAVPGAPRYRPDPPPPARPKTPICPAFVKPQ